MGCGASSAGAAAQPAADAKDKPPGKASWEALECSVACREAFSAAGIHLSVAARVVEELGVREEADFLMLTHQMVLDLHLKPVDQAKLLQMLDKGKQAKPPPDTTTASAAAASRSLVAPVVGLHGSRAVRTSNHRAPADPSGSMMGSLKELMQDKKRLTVLAQKGISLGVSFLQQVGPILPFPGSSAAELLSQLLQHVGGAIANKDNLTRLMERCTDLMGLMVAKLEPAAGSTGPQANQAYRSLVSRFADLLKDAVQYCSGYADRNFLMRMITSNGDAKDFQDLASRTTELTVEATFAVTVDAHGVSLDIKAQVDRLVVDMQARMAYVDHSADLRAFVASQPGGADAVLADPQLMQQAIETMEVGQQLSIKVMQQGFLRAAATANQGPHRIIRQKDLSELWHRFITGQEVDWEVWWSVFPEDMTDILDQTAYQQLCSCLAPDEARTAFQAAVDRRKPDVLSVDELRLSFPADVPLVHRVMKLVQSQSQTQAPTANSPAVQGSSTTGPATAPAAGKKDAHCSLPEPDALYVGREAEAERICSLLAGSTTEPARAVCLVAGGGLGKSSLALDIGWRLWRAGRLPGGGDLVNLRGAYSLAQQEQRLCAALGLACDDQAQQRLLTHMADQPAGQHLLLVLDNAEDSLAGPDAAAFAGLLSKMLSASTALLLLMTSRIPWPSSLPALPGYHDHTVPPVGTEPLQRLVRELCPAEDALSDAEVLQVVGACGGSPLLARLVADGCAHGHMTVQDALSAASGMSAHLSLSLRCLPRRQQQQLASLSVLPYTFSEEDAAAVLQCSVDRATTLLGSLYTHSLLLYDSSSAQHYVHMAVREQAANLASPGQLLQSRQVFVLHMLSQLSQWAAMYASPSFSLALSLARQSSVSLDEVWRLLAADVDVAKSCCRAAAEAATEHLVDLLRAASMLNSTALVWQALSQIIQEPAQRASLMAISSAIFMNQGQYATAEPMYREALELRKRVLGPEHPDTIASINNLAGCLDNQGQYATAEPMYREALELRKRVLGPEHPDTIESINNLAGCLGNQGQHATAEPMYRETLELIKRVLGPEHPNTIASINNLASCLIGQGQYATAEPMYREALELIKRVLGPEHPNTIASINNLASCLASQDQYEAAEPMCREALELRKRVLGPEHPDTIGSINLLALCLNNQGQHATAEPMYRETLELIKRVLGPEHPNTIASINNLASCLIGQGQYATAEPMYREALELRKRVLGPEHPDTIESINNLALCLGNQDQYATAEPMYLEALELRKRVLGPEHPDTIASINNLALCLGNQDQYATAEPMYLEALELRKRVLGPEHPDTIISINNLAICLHNQGQYATAEPMYREALELRKRVLGPEHQNTINSINNLANCLGSQDQYEAAEPMCREALEWRKRVLGPEHPDTITSINSLAICLSSQGQYATAEPIFREALELRHRVLGPEHPDTIDSTNGLANCLKAQGTDATSESSRI